MKSPEKCFDRESLEALYTQEEQKLVKEIKVFSILNSIWQHLVTFFTKEPELKVWKRSDRFGNIWWEAYDPFTGSSSTFGCEVDMLEWIERSYYAKNNSMF
jgi:hypothetical protein